MYILDGQQRITSLYAVRRGLIYVANGQNGDREEIDYNDISINLALDLDTDEEVVLIDPPDNTPFITVYELLSGDFTDWMDKYEKDQLKKIEVYKKG